MSKTDNTGEDVADKEDESMAELQQTMQVLLEGMTSIQQQLSAQGQELQELKRAKGANKDVPRSMEVLEQKARQAIKDLQKERRQSGVGKVSAVEFSDSDEDQMTIREELTERFGKKVKAIDSLIETAIKASQVLSEKKDERKMHRKMKKIIKKNMSNLGMKNIVAKSDEKYETFATDHEHADEKEIEEGVLDHVIETFGSGIAATKYINAMKLTGDVRQGYVAFRDAYHKTSASLTRRAFIKEMEEITFDVEDTNYEEMREELDELFAELQELRDPISKSYPYGLRDIEKLELIMKKMEYSQRGLETHQQTWAALFETTLIAYNVNGKELGMEDIDQIIKPKAEAMKSNKKQGQVHQQKQPYNSNNNRQANQGLGNGGKCYRWHYTGVCQYGPSCKWAAYHTEENANAASKQQQQTQQHAQPPQVPADAAAGDPQLMGKFKFFM